jgi:hypothetical protein
METLARLRAAITKEPGEINNSKAVDERSETDRRALSPSRTPPRR